MKSIGVLNSYVLFEIYRMDVSDLGVQSNDYFDNTIKLLSNNFPNISWQDRLDICSSRDTWVYPDNYFDIIISSQVCEHVHNHDLFFSEIYRTLCDGGFSIHLFPLKHYLYEGHLHLPLVHKILNYDLLLSYIKTLSRLGLGKYKEHYKVSSVTLNKFSELHADYMCFFTNYLSYSEILKLGKKYSLRTSFKYTQEYYLSKLRSILRMRPIYKYKYDRNAFIDWLDMYFLKYISSISVIFLQERGLY